MNSGSRVTLVISLTTLLSSVKVRSRVLFISGSADITVHLHTEILMN